METVQVHGIEQLKREIVNVTGSLEGWRQKLRSAETKLAQSTEQLEQCQETKRILTERLFEMLLESEEAKQERLQSVEQTLDTIEGDGKDTTKPVADDASTVGLA